MSMIANEELRKFVYMYYFMPDLLQITGNPCSWGVMDHYKAETLLEGKPEGIFLLRDSARGLPLFCELQLLQQTSVYRN